MKKEPPVSFERIQIMIAALESGEPMSEVMRKEIVDALDCLFIKLLAEDRAHAQARPFASDVWFAAAVVRGLVDEYGAMVKSAVDAAIPAPGNNNEKNRNKVKRTYHKLIEGVDFKIEVSPEIVAKAAKKLPRRPKK